MFVLFIYPRISNFQFLNNKVAFASSCNENNLKKARFVIGLFVQRGVGVIRIFEGGRGACPFFNSNRPRRRGEGGCCESSWLKQGSGGIVLSSPGHRSRRPLRERGERRRSSRNLRRNAKIVSQFVSRAEPSAGSWARVLSAGIKYEPAVCKESSRSRE